MRTAAVRPLVAFGLLLSLALMAGCGSDDPAERPEPAGSSSASPAAGAGAEGTLVVSFDFDELGALASAGLLGTGRVPLTNAASQPVTVHVAAAADGALRAEPGRDGGYAARFPAHVSGDPRRVVVTTFASGEDDPLGPGGGDFSFGADFILDRLSEEAGLDDGNNLVQRGLSGDPAQYKIQIDQGRASCRVAGKEGEVLVKSERTIVPETWYRVSCTRTGDEITLMLGSFDNEPERTVGSGATGAIGMSGTTPLVIGGKATEAGAVVESNSDQFNGAIDNVFLSRQ